jgi:hypothetical protein
MEQLAELFNVNHFIVSQVAIPFLHISFTSTPSLPPISSSGEPTLPIPVSDDCTCLCLDSICVHPHGWAAELPQVLPSQLPQESRGCHELLLDRPDLGKQAGTHPSSHPGHPSLPLSSLPSLMARTTAAEIAMSPSRPGTTLSPSLKLSTLVSRSASFPSLHPHLRSLEPFTRGSSPDHLHLQKESLASHRQD